MVCVTKLHRLPLDHRRPLELFDTLENGTLFITREEVWYEGEAFDAKRVDDDAIVDV